MIGTLSRTIRYLLIVGQLQLIVSGCSGMERSLKEKIRRENAVSEEIARLGSLQYELKEPEHRPRSPYPWELEKNLPRITKEFFRCRGQSKNPPFFIEGKEEPLADCEGFRHSLPIFNGKEGVYPILLQLLNFVQKKTGRRVIITSGHRCPAHNAYAEPSLDARTSKHQIGAEVDFYVQGMEDRPLEVIALLMQYYRETPAYQNQREYIQFRRFEGKDTGVKIEPWLNQEIYIKLFQRGEGRDRDNLHPYPYISIQVRYDREKQERVLYSWEKAYKGYGKK